MKEAKRTGDFDDFCKKNKLEEEKEYSFAKHTDESDPSTSSVGEGSEISFDPVACFAESLVNVRESRDRREDSKALLNNRYMRTKRSKLPV